MFCASPRSSKEEWCVAWLLLRCVSCHPAGDDLTVSPQSEKRWREWGWMALSVKGDHHSPPFHASAYIICLGGCAFMFHVWRNNTVSLSLTMNCLFLSSRSRRLQAGEREDCVHNRGEAAGGEDWASESGSRRWLCYQKTGTVASLINSTTITPS